MTVIKEEEPIEVETEGQAKLSGVLMGSGGSGTAKAVKNVLGKNAQGTMARVESAIPISGADIMFYESQSLSTASDTSVQSDENGHWEVELPPGNYFAFAVYFDRENLEIVTASLPNLKAIVSSGYSVNPVMSDYQTHDFDGIIAKPYKIEDFAQVVDSVIRKK